MDIKIGVTAGSTSAAAGGSTGGEAPSLTGTLPAADLVRGLTMNPYDTSIGFAGPSLTFTLSPASGALPSGLSLSATGMLSGTPTETVNARNIVIRAANADGFVDSGFQMDVVEPVFSAVINGAVINPTYGNTAQDQVVLTASASAFTGATPTGFQYQWKTVESGDIAGATGASFAPSADSHDLETLYCTITPDDYAAADTQILVIRHAPPTAAGGLPDEIFDVGTGDQTVATAYDFTGQSLSYAVSGPAGTSIAAATGVVSLSTVAAVSGALVEVTASNSGGSAVSNFLVTVEAVSSGASAVFGALTRSAAGGIDVTGNSVLSGDPSGHWQVAGNMLSPSPVGEDALSGVYQLGFDDGSSLEVTILPDEYSVRCDKAEIEAAHVHAYTNRAALNSLCSVRAGFTSDEIDLSGGTFSGSFTLRGAGFSTESNIRPWSKASGEMPLWTWESQIGNVLLGGANIHVEEIEIYTPRSSGKSAAIWVPPLTPLTGFSVRRCHIFGDHLGEMIELLRVAADTAAGDAIVGTLPGAIDIPADRDASNGVIESCYIHDFYGASGTDCDNYLFQGNMIRRIFGSLFNSSSDGPTGAMFYHNEATDFFGGLPDNEDITSTHYGLGGGDVINRNQPDTETNIRIRAMGNVVNIGSGRQDYEVSQGRYLVTPVTQTGYTGFKKNDGSNDVNGYSDGFFKFNIFQLQNPVGYVICNGDNEEISYNTLIGGQGPNAYHQGSDPSLNFENPGAYAFQDTRIGYNMFARGVALGAIEDQLTGGQFQLVENYVIENRTDIPTGATRARRYSDVMTGHPTKGFGIDLTPEELIAACAPKAGTYADAANLGAVGPYLTLGIPGMGTSPTAPVWAVPDTSGSAAAIGHPYPATVWDGSYGLSLNNDPVTGTAFNSGGAPAASGSAFFFAWQGRITGLDGEALTFMDANSKRLHISRPANSNRQLFLSLENVADERTVYLAPIGNIDAALGRCSIVISGDLASDRYHIMLNGRLFELNDYASFEFSNSPIRFGESGVRFFENIAGGERLRAEHEVLIFDDTFVDLKANGGAIVAQDGFLRDEAAIDAALGLNPLAFVQGNAAAFNGGNGNALARTQGVTVTNGGTVSDVSAITAPDAFVDADWSVATGSGANALEVTIASMPSDNGAAITVVEYDIDGAGSWVALPSYAGAGSYTLTMAAASTNYAIRLRAVNSVGNGAAGNSESATSGGAAAGVELATFASDVWIDISADHGNSAELVYAFRGRRLLAAGAGSSLFASSGNNYGDTYFVGDDNNDRMGSKFETNTGSAAIAHTGTTNELQQNEALSFFIRLDGAGNSEIVVDGVQVAANTNAFAAIKAFRFINAGDATGANANDLAIEGFAAFSASGCADAVTGLSFSDFFDGSNAPVAAGFSGSPVSGYAPDVAFDTVASWNAYGGKSGTGNVT